MTFMKQINKLFKKNNYVDTQVTYKNSTSKYSMTAGCTMELSGSINEKKKEINETLKPVVKKYMDNPEKLIQYIRFKGAKVYKSENMVNLLSFIGEEEGFIAPLKGMKALALTVLLSVSYAGKIKIGLSTPEMFIFNKRNTEIYTVIRAMHKYYGFKNNLPGFDFKSQAIFKKIYGKNKNTQQKLNNLPLKDVLACRDALARDLESINFTLQLSLEHEQSKKALNKIITDKNAKI